MCWTTESCNSSSWGCSQYATTSYHAFYLPFILPMVIMGNVQFLYSPFKVFRVAFVILTLLQKWTLYHMFPLSSQCTIILKENIISYFPQLSCPFWCGLTLSLTAGVLMYIGWSCRWFRPLHSWQQWYSTVPLTNKLIFRIKFVFMLIRCHR